MRKLQFLFMILNLPTYGTGFVLPAVPLPKINDVKSWHLATIDESLIKQVNQPCRRRGPTKLFAGTTLDPPPTYDHDKEKKESSIISDFKKRMDELFRRDGSLTESYATTDGSLTPSPIKTPRPNYISVVRSLQEFKDVVAAEKEKIVVVRWYASYCRSCKAIQPYFYRLAEQYREEKVLFVEIPISEKNAILHQGLGIPSIPFGHIYHPAAGLVEELKISQKVFPIFAQILECYVEGSCSLLDDGSCDPPFTIKASRQES